MKEIVKDCFKNIEHAYERKPYPLSYDGMSTGFDNLYEITGGLKKGDLNVVAGRPAMGVTSFVLNIASKSAFDGMKILMFAPLLTYNKIALKLFASISHVDLMRLSTGSLGEVAWPKLIRAASRLSENPITVNCRSYLRVQHVSDTIHEYTIREKAEPDIVIIDGLQVIRDEEGKKYDSMNHELSEVVRELKHIAKSKTTAIIATSQLNRSVEERTNKRPLLSDLRDSGSIEALSDLLIFIYRSDVYNRTDENPEKGIAEIIVAKNVMGPIGIIKLAFHEKWGSFENIERNNA